MASSDKITANEIISLLYHAYSVEVWELADAARRKWYEKYKGTEKADEVILPSGTMVGMREWQLRTNEAEGKDCAKMIAEQEATFSAQMKQWIYEGLHENEAEEVWLKWVEDEQDFHRYIAEAVQKTKSFVSQAD